jgi:hypothetical protein
MPNFSSNGDEPANLNISRLDFTGRKKVEPLNSLESSENVNETYKDDIGIDTKSDDGPCASTFTNGRVLNDSVVAEVKVVGAEHVTKDKGTLARFATRFITVLRRRKCKFLWSLNDFT